MTNVKETERQTKLEGLSAIGPDGVDGFGQYHYKLGEFVIIYYHGEIDWVDCREEDDGEISQLAGEAFIEDCGVLLISPGQVCDRAEWKTLDDFRKWRDSFPVWDETRYFARTDDTGGITLLDCKTLEPASKEERERIIPELRKGGHSGAQTY